MAERPRAASAASALCAHDAVNRRRLIAASGGVALALEAVAAKPTRMKPQPGDLLAHAFGDRAGELISPEDVGAEPLSAFPLDAAIRLVRDGSLHNQLLVVRVDSAAVNGKARDYLVEADGAAFIVYSAACTHTGCEVNGWNSASRRLVCPCHRSEFDVHAAAAVVNGPAPRPLAMLKTELLDGNFRVVGQFSRRVGPEPP